MDKLESHISKEAAWRSRLLRHAQSGKSIAAFCRDEQAATDRCLDQTDTNACLLAAAGMTPTEAQLQLMPPALRGYVELTAFDHTVC